ncbi:Tcp11-domain-containing protein [Myriangium duriaei CBS 260.36]|uniref:Tcp11-domain-containing protein n=1 Tax=Myriangium duriaei CBS 260.36 TaxID=1168546 RepID=A0A9P4MKD9_9PEZI|nr:Tcp11-domain-containing protein [Myriangium duriaei CBS 260.36]
MDTSDGANASRRDSVSHAQPAVYDSPSCRRTAREKVEKVESVETPSSAPIASASESLGPERNQSYAFEQERSKHVSSLLRKRSRSKSHKPRQSSRSDSTQLAPVSSFSRNNSSLTDVEIESQLLQLLEQVSSAEDADMSISYSKASSNPPITSDSLSELDIARIINNPKLRHDVNFDKELHFRPNLDGSRGRQKLRAADDYWKALVAELTLYTAVGAKLRACTTTHDAEYWTRMMSSSQKRLPVMFETIRNILKTLVPERDQPAVAERMDVAMIMQEISKGLFDMMSLAQWLSTLLKAHCAPMRDEWIDQMVGQVQKGIESNCQKRIIAGLRQLLGILEAMKLDVANHQIRHLRAVLIEDGVNFQQKYHLTRMHYGRLDTARARRWFFREHSRHLTSNAQPDKVRVFIAALFKALLSQSSVSSLPETFSLDSDRLRAMRADLHNLIYLEICLDVFDSALESSVSEEVRNKARKSFASTLPSIVGDSRRFVDCASNIAVEIVRQCLEAERSDEKFNTHRTELAEGRLESELVSSSLQFARQAKRLYATYAPQLEKMVRENLPLTPLTLHDRMFAPSSQQATLGAPSAADKAAAAQQSKSIKAVLGRICHVAVLHWHIWSPLVYDVVEEENGPLSPSSLYDSEGSCTSGSDTESEAGSDVSEVATPCDTIIEDAPSTPSSKTE